MKNSSDIIENRTFELPACSAVFQPTLQPPSYSGTQEKNVLHGVSRKKVVFSAVSLEAALVRQSVAAEARDVLGFDEESKLRRSFSSTADSGMH